jgi:DNA modification methylase
MTEHKIIIGDARDMREIKSESTHLVVTSPPYWQLKDYGDGRQIGYNDSYEDYINNLNLVWDECYRVLHKGCRLCINIGDQFARSVYYGRYKVIPIRTEIIKFCETRGFDYMGAIIWRKVTTCHTTGGATVMGSFPYPRSGILKLDYEFILVFKKLGRAPAPKGDAKEKSKLTTDEWNEYFAGHWNFAGERQEEHLAPFPEELPYRLIRMFTFVGDTVLDPFLGRGTTAGAAIKLGRNSIGYEINPSYEAIIREYLKKSADLFSADGQLEFGVQDVPTVNFKDKLEKLPYRFKDPLGFKRRVDPKRHKYGSRIDDTELPINTK